MAIDSVLDPPRIQIIVGVHSLGPAIRGCPENRKRRRPPKETMLATTGAHMYAAKRLLAVRIWPSRV